MPGTSQQLDGDVGSDRPVEHEPAVGDAAGQLERASAGGCCGIGRTSASTAASAAGCGKTWVSGPPSTASGAPAAATMRPATVRPPATEICWPTTARTAVSNGSTLPGTRSPGTAATHGASSVVGGQRGVDGHRIGVEVEQPPDPPTAASRSRRSASRSRARTARRCPAQRPSPRRRRARPAGRARGGTPGRPRARRPARRGRRGTRAGDRRRTARTPAARPRPPRHARAATRSPLAPQSAATGAHRGAATVGAATDRDRCDAGPQQPQRRARTARRPRRTPPACRPARRRGRARGRRDGADLEEHRERADRDRPLALVDPVDGERHQRRVQERRCRRR